MRRVPSALRYSTAPEAEPDDSLDALGNDRPLCTFCDQPIKPGDEVISIQISDVLHSRKSGQDVFVDKHFEDGDSEKLYHIECIQQNVPLWFLGMDSQRC